LPPAAIEPVADPGAGGAAAAKVAVARIAIPTAAVGNAGRVIRVVALTGVPAGPAAG